MGTIMPTTRLSHPMPLPINLHRKFSTQRTQGIQSQCLQFILTRIDVNRSKKRNTLLQSRSDVFRMSHPSRKQNGIYLAIENNGGSSHTFGNLVNHSIQHQLGMLVARFDSLLYGRDIRCAQMGGQSCTAGNALLQLFFRKAAGIA